MLSSTAVVSICIEAEQDQRGSGVKIRFPRRYRVSAPKAPLWLPIQYKLQYDSISLFFLLFTCFPDALRSQSIHNDLLICLIVMTNNLLDLPHEVLHCIFTHVDPHDIAHLSCCRALRAFIKCDRVLFRDIYLKNFVRISRYTYESCGQTAEMFHQDDPRQGTVHKEVFWEEELHRLVNTDKILESRNEALKARSLLQRHPRVRC